MLVMKSVGFIL